MADQARWQAKLAALASAGIGAALLAVLAFACSTGSAGEELQVFAASSLTDPFTEIGAAFEAQHPETHVRFNFAGSPTLRAQMAQGAPADVYASADERNMRQALDEGLVEADTEPFTRNELAILIPSDNPGGVREPADLAKPGRKVVLAGAEVPVGGYARQALRKMAADPAFGTGFDERVLANVVSNEPNVKAVVAKVQLGEADAGIAYTSDVTPELAGDIDSIPIPEAYNVAATYPVAVATDARDAETAREFVEFLLSDEAQAILEDWGFERVR